MLVSNFLQWKCITANYSILQKHNTSCFLHKTFPWHGYIKQKHVWSSVLRLLAWLGSWSRVRMDWVRIDAISSSREGAELDSNWIRTPVPPLPRHGYRSEPLFLYQWHRAVIFKVIIKIWGVYEAPGTLEVLDTQRLAMCVWLAKAQMLLSPWYSPDITSQTRSVHSFCFGGSLFHPSSIHCVIINWIWFRLPPLGGRSYVSAFYT